MGGPPLDEFTESLVQRLAKSGLFTKGEIAIIVERCPATVWRRVHNVPTKVRVDEIERPRGRWRTMVEMSERGMRIRDIARELEVSPPAVSQALKRHRERQRRDENG